MSAAKVRPTDVVRAAVAQEQTRCFAVAVDRWGADVVAGIDVEWGLHGISRAGSAEYATGRVRLNARFANADPGGAVVTVAHEIAHVVAWRLYGVAGRGHGPRWRYVMAALGHKGAPAKLFSLAAARVVAEYRVARGGMQGTCACPGVVHGLTRGQRERLLRGTARYRCPNCWALLCYTTTTAPKEG